MDQTTLDRFRRCAALHGAGKLAKIARAPLRMGYSLAADKWSRATGTARTLTARTFWGERMNVVFPERGSVSIYRYRFIEEGLTSIFLANVTPGMTVFDIGAHFGYFTLLASELVGARGQVHSFEPTPSSFEILQRNAAARANIRLNNLAVFSRADELTFQDFGVIYSQYNSLTDGRLKGQARATTQAHSFTVKTVTVDDYVAQSGARPDFIKIDAENAEHDILLGMDRTLADVKPMITLEVGDVDPEHSSSKPVQFLLDRAYRAYEYDRASHSIIPHTPRANYPFDNLLFVADAKGR